MLLFLTIFFVTPSLSNFCQKIISFQFFEMGLTSPPPIWTMSVYILFFLTSPLRQNNNHIHLNIKSFQIFIETYFLDYILTQYFLESWYPRGSFQPQILPVCGWRNSIVGWGGGGGRRGEGGGQDCRASGPSLLQIGCKLDNNSRCFVTVVET